MPGCDVTLLTPRRCENTVAWILRSDICGSLYLGIPDRAFSCRLADSARRRRDAAAHLCRLPATTLADGAQLYSSNLGNAHSDLLKTCWRDIFGLATLCLITVTNNWRINDLGARTH